MAQDEFAQIIEFLRSRQGRELSHTELESTLTERCRRTRTSLSGTLKQSSQSSNVSSLRQVISGL